MLCSFQYIPPDAENFREVALAYPNGLIQYDHFTHRSAERVR